MKDRGVLTTLQGRVRSVIRCAVAVLFIGIAATPAGADVIDSIEITQVGDEARIQIELISRIQYLRHATLKNGDVRIYLNLLEVDALDPRLVHETRDAPPSEIAPHFTVTYPELDSSLTIRFSDKVPYRLLLGRDGRSFVIYTPLIKPPIQPAPIPTPPLPAIVVPPTIAPVIAPPAAEPAYTPSAGAPTAADDVEQEAKRLIDSARSAMKQGQDIAAIESLNRLLNLPPNRQSQPAQALIGEAREKLGEYAKARVEYELYLKLYPNAKDFRQVQERLAKLPGDKSGRAQSITGAVRKEVAEEKMTVFGSFSQDYSKGISYTDGSTLGVPIATLTTNDQSQLISTLDMTGRKRTETVDTRLVLRDSHTANFLPGQNTNRNRLNTAYIEQSGRDRSYRYRVGRQSGASGGLPGRFDGAFLSYNLDPLWRVNGAMGAPVEFIGAGVDQKAFVGMSVDLTRSPEQWSGSAYFVESRVAGVTDRRAVGAEARYFDARRNCTALLDFDTLFKAVNIAMFQGNWGVEAGSNYFVLLDHRKTPPLQLSNALPGQTLQSIDALVRSGVSVETLRADAQALSATSELYMIGVTHPYSSRLQLGGDVRMTSTSATRATGIMPATPATGDTYIYTLQAVGNNLLLENDLGVASFSYTNAQAYKGQTWSFSQVEMFRKNWRLDLSLQYYSQKDTLDVSMTRVTPSLKLSYHMSDAMSFEGEGGMEDTHTYSATQDERIKRTYFSIGYRWDF